MRDAGGSFGSTISLGFSGCFVEVVGRTLSVGLHGGPVGVGVVFLGEVFGRSAPLLLDLKEAKQN